MYFNTSVGSVYILNPKAQCEAVSYFYVSQNMTKQTERLKAINSLDFYFMGDKHAGSLRQLCGTDCAQFQSGPEMMAEVRERLDAALAGISK